MMADKKKKKTEVGRLHITAEQRIRRTKNIPTAQPHPTPSLHITAEQRIRRTKNIPTAQPHHTSIPIKHNPQHCSVKRNTNGKAAASSECHWSAKND
jgi:hypothetical protein